MNKQDKERLSTKVWKSGCNWKGCERSFYSFIKREGIVISGNRFPFEVGDLVAITEGFTVIAIAKVLSQRFPITTKPEYKSLEKEYFIDYEDSTFFAKAEWYVLPKDKIFTYKVQRGAARVRKTEIIDKVIEFWNNRDSKIQFISTS